MIDGLRIIETTDKKMPLKTLFEINNDEQGCDFFKTVTNAAALILKNPLTQKLSLWGKSPQPALSTMLGEFLTKEPDITPTLKADSEALIKELTKTKDATWAKYQAMMKNTEMERLTYLVFAGWEVPMEDGRPAIDTSTGAQWRFKIGNVPIKLDSRPALPDVKGKEEEDPHLPRMEDVMEAEEKAAEADTEEHQEFEFKKAVPLAIDWGSKESINDSIKEVSEKAKVLEEIAKKARPEPRKPKKGTAKDRYNNLPIADARTAPRDRARVRRPTKMIDPDIKLIISENKDEFKELLRVYLESGEKIREILNEQSFSDAIEEIKFIEYNPEMIRKLMAAMAVKMSRKVKDFTYDVLVICTLARNFGSRINKIKMSKMSEKGRTIAIAVRDTYGIQFTFAGAPAPDMLTTTKVANSFPSHHVLAGRGSRCFIIEDILPVELQCQSGVVFIIGNEIYNYIYFAMEFDRITNSRRKKPIGDKERFAKIMGILQVTMNFRKAFLSKESRSSVRTILGLPKDSAAMWAKDYDWLKEQYTWVEDKSKKMIAGFISKV